MSLSGYFYFCGISTLYLRKYRVPDQTRLYSEKLALPKGCVWGGGRGRETTRPGWQHSKGKLSLVGWMRSLILGSLTNINSQQIDIISVRCYGTDPALSYPCPALSFQLLSAGRLQSFTLTPFVLSYSTESHKKSKKEKKKKKKKHKKHKKKKDKEHKRETDSCPSSPSPAW